MPVPSGSLNDLASLVIKHPTAFSIVSYASAFLLGRKTKPLSAIKALFGWAGEIVEAFYEFKARCAESRDRHVVHKQHAVRASTSKGKFPPPRMTGNLGN